MSLNNRQIIEQTKTAASKLLKDKGYVSGVDVLMEIGKLSNQDYENWRHQKVPYLEKVIQVNLSKINTILRTLQKYSQDNNLKPRTAPTAHQMITTLEKQRLIEKIPGQARTIRILLPRENLPDLD